MKTLINILLPVIATLLAWDYPADEPNHNPITFNVYWTTDLREPFVLLTQVPYVPGVTDYQVNIDAQEGLPAAFFTVSASNSVGESFAVKD